MPTDIDTPFDVDELHERYRKQKEDKKKREVFEAVTRIQTAGDPDENAADMQLAYGHETLVNPKYRIPLSFMQRNRDKIDGSIKRQKNTKILSKSPMLMRWLNNEKNAKLAADDLPALAKLEAALGYAGNSLKRMFNRGGQSFSQIQSDMMLYAASQNDMTFTERYRQLRGERYDRGFFEDIDASRKMIDTHTDEEGNINFDALKSDLDESGSDPLVAFAKASFGTFTDMMDRVSGQTKQDNIDAAIEWQKTAAEFARAAQEEPYSSHARRGFNAYESDEPLTFEEAVRRTVDLAINDPGALAAMVAEVGVESVGSVIPAAGVTLVTRNPSAGVATLGGTSYTLERGLESVKFFAERGYDLTKTEDVQRAFDKPELLQEAADRGHIRGLIIGALDLVSGGIAGQALAKNPIADAALQSIVQGTLGGGGEGLAQYATDDVVDYGEVIIEALAEFSTAPVDVVAIGARKLGEKKTKAQNARTRAETIQELSGLAVDSKLRERSPSYFRAFVESMTRGTDLDTMYFPAEEFIRYFQKHDIKIEQAAEILPGVDIEQVRRASVTGEDISMPVSTYMEQVAGSDMDQFVIDNVKFKPDDMTAAEARVFENNAQLEEARLAAQQEAAETTHVANQVAEETIYNNVVDQLVEAGRLRMVAEQEAQLYPAFYKIMAERLGTTVETLMGRYKPPKIESAQTQQPRGVKTDTLPRDIADMRERIRVRSLGGSLEAVTPKNNYLDAMEQATRDAGLNPDTATEEDIRAVISETIYPNRSVAGSSDIKVKIAQALNGEVKEKYVDDLMGVGFDVVSGDTTVQLAVKETDTKLVLTSIAVKHTDDMSKVMSNTGRGAKVLNVLKNIAHRTGKTLEVVGVTAEAEGFYTKQGLIKTGVSSDNGLTYTYHDPNMYKQEERGRIRLMKDGPARGQAVIELFKEADLSTFLHESGHFFLSILQDIAKQDDVPTEIQEMITTVQSWWKDNAKEVAKDGGNGITEQDVLQYIDEGTTGDVAKDAAVDVGMHEQWARAFEAYLMEGKAPTASLRAAFEQFRAWLLEVYKKIRGDLNVEITDDIRQVFDMLLATDEEIANANVDNSGDMLATTAAELGVSEEDYTQLAKLHQEAQDQMAAHTIQAAMAPIRRMRDKAFKERRAEIQEEVETEVNSRRVYRAIEWLGNKRWLGAEEQLKIPSGMRLNKEQLIERYGPGILRTLPRGSFRVYTPEGMDIDEVAGWFGYSSGDELVRDMEQAPKRKMVIANETDRRAMDELSKDFAIASASQEATAAFHGDKRGDYIAAELRTLYKLTKNTATARISTASYTRQVARRTIAGLRTRDAVASNRYLAAERKAAEQAQKAFAQGNRQAAADFKRRQLLNHMMFIESRKVTEEVGKLERLAKRLNSKGTRKNLAPDYLGAIDDVLEQYDFRKIGPGKEKNRERMLAYVEMMKNAGRESEIAIPTHILENAKAEPYMTLTVERLRGVYATLKNIEHTARNKQKLRDAKRARDLEKIIKDMEETAASNINIKAPERVQSTAERRRNDARALLNILVNPNSLLREYDGYETVGVFYDNIKRDIDEAMERLQVRREKATEAIEQLRAVYSKEERKDMAVRRYVPELGISLSKWDLISVVYNMGNADNIQRLTDPKTQGAFTREQLDAAVDTLDKKDLDYVQSVWDYIDSFYPEIKEREMRTKGIAPPKVEAQQLVTRHGVYKGGYFPLKYDVRDAEGNVVDPALEDLYNNVTTGAVVRAHTRDGHTKARAASSGKMVLIDESVFHMHILEVMHDLELQEPINNTNRILKDARVRGLFSRIGRQEDYKALELWLQDAATGQISNSHPAMKVARALKTGFTLSKLAFNLSTVLVQVTGLAQSAVVVGKRRFVRGTALYARNRSMYVKLALEASPFMAEREKTFQKDLLDEIDRSDIGTVKTTTEHIQKFSAVWGTYLMRKVQFHTVDMPTWVAVYTDAKQKGVPDDVAITEANRMVEMAQAGGTWTARTAIERGTLSANSRQNDVIKLFTTLGSYMFAKFNVARDRTKQTDFTNPYEFLNYAVDMVLLFTLEAVLYNFIKGTLPNIGDDEDEEGWVRFLTTQTLYSGLSTIPFVRDASSVLQGFDGGGAYGSITSTLAEPLNDVLDGSNEKAALKAVINATGVLTSLPSTQVNRLVDASWRQLEGEDVAPIEYIMGKR